LKFSEIINAKVRRPYLERMWRKSRTQLNRSRYSKPCHFSNRLVNKATSDFYRNMISNNSDNPHQLWNCINRTLRRKASVSQPALDWTNSLCHSFSKHFKDKIAQIHASFPVSASSCNIDFPVVHHSCAVFKPVSLTEVSKLIFSSSNKTCELHPVPIFLLKSCLYTLIVPITQIINVSISYGVLPSYFKHAHVIPTLKKSSLPVNNLYSYRPIYNISLISKVLEKSYIVLWTFT